MLKILVLIVSLNFAFISLLNAKELPIDENIKLIIPTKKTILLEFPFEIKVKKKPFYSLRIKKREVPNLEKIIDKPDLNKFNTDLNNAVNKKVVRRINRDITKKSSSFSLKASKNIIEIYAKKEGKTEVIVFGYKHPMIINVEVKKNDSNVEVERYYRFKDLTKKKEDTLKFESEPHERNLRRILVALYKDEPPKGYKVEYADITQNKDGLVQRLEKRIIGYNYVGEVWSIQNIDNSVAYIHDEAFLNENIYLVCPEADMLKKGETTRLFIIRDNL